MKISQTLIFDLDGTLVDSKKALTEAVNRVRRDIYALAPMTADRLAKLLNRPNEELPRLLYGVDRYDARAHAYFIECYGRLCTDESTLFEGIYPLLERLHAHGHTLCVATNGPTFTAEKVLNHLKVSHFFSDIVGADRVERAKPDPAMIELILTRLNRKSAYMIGDSQKDILAALSAGIQPVFVEWGYGDLDRGAKGVIRVAEPIGIEAMIGEKSDG